MTNFERKSHARSADGNTDSCTLVLTSDDPVLDEVAAADLLQALVEGRRIPVFGVGLPIVQHIGFVWSLTEAEQARYGEQAKVLITVRYLVSRRWLTGEDRQSLLSTEDETHDQEE